MERLKSFMRLIEARIAPRRVEIRFRAHGIRAVRSVFWNDAHQHFFDTDILPYFETLAPSVDSHVIVDAGAGCGLFSLAAALFFPAAAIWAFEPSAHQRILLTRNLAMNQMGDRIRMAPFGLWDCETHLAFRTHGALSSIREVSALPNYLPFSESAHCVTLDGWARQSKLQRLDLIKMDIEGAEIEALRGASEVLRKYHPRLLVQAYHLRDDGMRTLEHCAHFLDSLGYKCREVHPDSGLLDASIDLEGNQPASPCAELN